MSVLPRLNTNTLAGEDLELDSIVKLEFSSIIYLLTLAQYFIYVCVAHSVITPSYQFSWCGSSFQNFTSMLSYK